MKLVLVRHPRPDVAPGVCYGRLDLALSPDASGTASALVADLAMRGLARVWTSPARRCQGVAAMAAATAGIPLRVEPNLQELAFGAWEGVAWDAVPRAALDVWASDPHGFSPPGGESGGALLALVAAVHRALLAACEDAAVVSHGGPLKLLAALLRGDAPDLLSQAPAFGSIQVFTDCREIRSKGP